MLVPLYKSDTNKNVMGFSFEKRRSFIQFFHLERYAERFLSCSGEHRGSTAS